MRLTPKLTLVFVIYASTLLVSVAWLAYTSGRESLRSATVSELQSTAIEKQAALNEWVEEKRADIAILATSPTTIESVTNLVAASLGSLEAQHAHDRFVMEVQARVTGGEFLVVMLLDPSSGQVIAATTPGEEGKFKENRLFFLNGKNAPYVQNVYYSISLQGPAMTASAPLHSADGKLLGVLAGRLDLDEMNAIINRRTGLWQTEEAFLVNTSNLFVTQPRLSPNQSVLQQGVHSEAVNRCQSQTSGSLSALDYRSIPALIVYRWLPEHDLCLIVKIDQAEALAPAFEFGHSVIVISAIALLGATALGVFLSRGITRPIRRMQSGMVRFGQGEQEIRLPEGGQDELGALAREFNKMAASLVEKDARLHEYATDLERKVDERTAAIKQREERYRSYIEVTGQIGWTTNPQGEVEEDIASWRKFTGQSEEEVKGWGWSKALHPDDLEYATETWKQTIAAKTNYEVEYRIRRFDGMYRHFLARGVPIYTVNGHIQEWVGTCIDITERKHAEETLRRFELLSEHSRDIILFIRQSDGHILEANAAAVQAYGYNRDELLALTAQDLRARDTYSLANGQMAKADSVDTLFETVHVRRNGSTFPVEVSSQGATISGIRSLVSIVRDVTERRRAEEVIASLSKFPTENPNPVLRVQNDGQVTYANAASRELLEMWGCEINGYLPAQWKELIAETVESESDRTVDVSCNSVVYSIMMVPILESGYVNLYGRDVTARMQAEQALFESQEKYRLIADNANDWIYWIKPDRSFRYISPSCERITGFTYLDFMITPDLFSEIVHLEDREWVESHITKIQDEAEAEHLEYRIVTKAGEMRWISHSCAPMYSVDGKYIGRRGTNHDITERKQAEGELNRTMEELKASNAELEQFAYVASHDLQEPLRGIAGLAQLLQQRYEGQLDSQADEFINLIVDGTQRMQTLINDLLAYSRIGRRGETIRSTEAEAALKATIDNLTMAVREYGATITYESLPTVKADATQLIQLFQNLIGNAIKFRAERPPQIHVGVSDAGNFWQFSVLDNGIGIEPQYFERIFLVFQQLHTRREYKGTGIGLAICKKIIERHGGNIWVESEVGKGSTFYFTLPKGN